MSSQPARQPVPEVSSWEVDPAGQHQYRWWDGEQWTDHVADDGVVFADPIPEGIELEDPASARSGDPLPHPMSMAPPRGKRLAAFVLEWLIWALTVGVGWAFWSLVVHGRGQTPAKHLLKLRVIHLPGRSAASRRKMIFREMMRAVPFAFMFSLFPPLVVLGVVLALANLIFFLLDSRHQTIWDRALDTTVISDPEKLYDPFRGRMPADGPPKPDHAG